MMDAKSRFLVNAVCQYASTIVSMLLGIIAVPFLLRILGTEMFGLTALFTSLFATAQLLEMGMGTTLGRFLTTSLVENDLRKYNSYFSTALAVCLALSLVAVGVLAVFSVPILRICGVPEDFLSVASFAFVLNIIYSAAIGFILPVIRAVYVSRHRFDLISIIFSGMQILQVLGWFAVLSFYPKLGILGWSIVNMAAGALVIIVGFLGAYKLQNGLKFSIRLFSKTELKSMYSVSWKVFVDRFMGYAEVSINPILLSTFGSLVLNAIYKPAVQALGFVFTILLQTSSQIMPHSSEAAAKGDMGRVKDIYLTVLRMVFVPGIMSVVFMFFFAQGIFHAWIGRELGELTVISANVFLIFLFAQVLATSSAIQTPILVGINRLSFMTACNVIRTAIGLTAGILLLIFTDLGVYAIVLPAAVLKILTSIAQSLYIRKILVFDSFEQILRVYVPAVLCAGLYYGIVRLYMEYASRGNLFADIAVAMAASLPLMFFIGFNRRDRSMLFDAVRKITTRFS